jgi:hypothetical protein
MAVKTWQFATAVGHQDIMQQFSFCFALRKQIPYGNN